ncbi:endonuclease [Faecalicatena sp. AGMB00832]|uniref:Endonuclease n=1 Tax=Faecalicatena faecalis TaxID=2726362 RepID=A0ABS6D5R4_9FIRM|nr:MULTISPECIES: endonuclease [Faecalicatena]MBU3876803.1 endonuclease [Faecalicatena faecalis]MCI6467234.1 endonuclease [Faecalicatena sp.]MDY5620239.1 endonuclease [Lachnospiraceae bacterium]
MKKKRKGLKIAGGIVLGIILILALAVGYLTIREYRPDAVEAVEPGNGTDTMKIGDSFTVLTYNTGYAGLSKDEDFFMDGGSKVQPESQALVEHNMKGISSILEKQNADVYFLQEVDRDSKRSFHIDEQKYYENALELPGMFACNFKCDFVPYPLPPIGKVTSGLVTMTDLNVTDASRIALPESFTWPVKTCNLKRCMLETRIPLEGSDKELVMINFHLEAYDSGEGKIAQSKMLAEKLEAEYEKGNYVIAGGDFNQTFEGMEKYPIHNQDDWVPGVVSTEDIPEGFSFAVSDNVPTCRLLNGPYSGNYDDSQVYVLDGFIVSDNIQVQKVENIDTQFEYTDHQPVRLEAILK